MIQFFRLQLEWLKDFFDEVQPDKSHKPSIKNLCAFMAYLAFYVAVVKEVILNHSFPDISTAWVTLLVSVAGVKMVGTIAQNLTHKDGA